MTLVEYLERKVQDMLYEAQNVLNEEEFKEFCYDVKNLTWDLATKED